MYDVIIIGAGVSGAATARELSRYSASICVLEAAEDVCCGTSKANSGIAHAGYDAKPGTLMARLNVLGSQMLPALARELDFPFVPCGSFVACRSAADLPKLQQLLLRGQQNGVQGLEIITDAARLRQMEPNLDDGVVAVLHAPTAGVVCPFGLNIAMAENACTNGVTFRFNTRVTAISPAKGGWQVCTTSGDFAAKCVVNAAGVHAAALHNMVSERKLCITPRRGDYLLLDKTAGGHVGRTIFSLPGAAGKGVLVAPTAHGNLIVGPTAIDTNDFDTTATTRNGLDEVLQKAGTNVKNLPLRQVIASFAGQRAHEAGHEFIIGEVADAAGFFDCAGIESPGLVSSPAIGQLLAGLLAQKLHLAPNPNFDGRRVGIPHFASLPPAQQAALVAADASFGNVICRCETVTEGEILSAIRRPLGARSLDGIKRRTRAGMGRCQAGFCSPKVMQLLHAETGIPMQEITKSGGDSRLIVGQNKDAYGGDSHAAL